jgi:hypothetical protein
VEDHFLGTNEEVRSRQGFGGIFVTLIKVVPAHVGTLNHRIWLLQKGACHTALLTDHAVWVPAFGTTPD